MKKKISFIIILNIILISQVFSQSLNDTLFKNVIKIDDENISKIGKSFLINIPLKEKNKFLIIFNNSQIPNNLFFSKNNFAPNLTEFILIFPNFEYYKRIGNYSSKYSKIKCAEPLTSEKLYHIKRNYNNFKIDSLTITGNKQKSIILKNPENKFKDSILSFLSEKTILNSLQDDKSYKTESNRIEFIKKFEKNNKLKIGKIYLENIDNNENVFYYCLNSLNSKNKLKFILQRKYDLIPNKHLKKISPPKEIYFPELITTKDKTEEIEYFDISKDKK